MELQRELAIGGCCLDWASSFTVFKILLLSFGISKHFCNKYKILLLIITKIAFETHCLYPNENNGYFLIFHGELVRNETTFFFDAMFCMHDDYGSELIYNNLHMLVLYLLITKL